MCFMRKIIKLSSTIPQRVKFVAGAFRACNVLFDLYQVEPLGRHGFWVFVVSSHVHQWMVECASLLKCIVMPMPLDNDDLEYKIKVYVSKLPLTL